MTRKQARLVIWVAAVKRIVIKIHRDEHGQYVIHPSEMSRYGEIKQAIGD